MTKTTRNPASLRRLGPRCPCPSCSKNAPADLAAQVVLITGGSRGLGLALATSSATTAAAWRFAPAMPTNWHGRRKTSRARGYEVYTSVCDLTDTAQVERADRRSDGALRADRHSGQQRRGHRSRAGAEMTRRTLKTRWPWTSGACWTRSSRSCRRCRRGKAGRIVNITSIGGKVAFPHLLPYAAAKFAATGLSEGLHSELKRDGITVTTIVPGLLRTGSYFNALFKGDKTGGVCLVLARRQPARRLHQRRACGPRDCGGHPARLRRAHFIGPGKPAGPCSGRRAKHDQSSADADQQRSICRRRRMRPGSDMVSPGKDAEPTVPLRPAFDAVTALGRSAAERLNE